MKKQILKKQITLAFLLILFQYLSEAGTLNVDAGMDTVICSTASLQMNAGPLAGNQTGMWTVINGNGTFADPSDPQTMVTNLVLGENVFKWTVDETGSGPGSLDFSGFSEYVTVPHDASLDPGSEWTLEVWANLNSSASNQKIIGKTTASFDGGYMMAVETSNLYPEFWDLNGVNHSFHGGTVPSGTWTHLGLTWTSGGDLVGYIDGMEVSRITASTANLGSNTADLIIGAAPWDVGFFEVAGKLDEIRIWDKAIDSMTLVTYKDSIINNSHPDYNNLISYYPMSAGSGTVITDNKGSNDGTISGATWSTDNAPVTLPPNQNCSGSDSIKVTLGATPTVTFSALEDACLNDSPFLLSGGDPAGGTYSGTGVSNDEFDAAVSGTGDFTITYTYTDGDGCSASSSRLLSVNENPPKPTVLDSNSVLLCEQTADSYAWYEDGTLVGDDSPAFDPFGLSGGITVIITVDGCESEPSDPYFWVSVEDKWIENSIKVNPNPAEDFVIIDWQASDLKVNLVEIIDISGSIIRLDRIVCQKRSAVFQVNDLSSGMYFIKISTPEHTGYKKLILL